MKPIKLLLLLWFLSVCLQAGAQRNLFKASPAMRSETLIRKLDAKSIQTYNQYQNNPFVSRVLLVEIDPLALNESQLVLNMDKNITARKTVSEKRSDGNFSWFGQLDDETGIFFTVMGNSVMSKFYNGGIPCTLLPLSGSTHMLVEYAPAISDGVCRTAATNHDRDDEPLRPETNEPQMAPPLFSDNSCTVRLLITVTATAEAELALNLDQVAQMLADETNLAYQQSQVSFRVEIARVMRTTYNEVNTFEGNGQSTDVVRFRNGMAPLNAVHDMRNVYQSDVQVMIRRGSFFLGGGGQLFGEAFEVPTGVFGTPNPDNAFCWIVTDFIIGGRFTFAHEIGHLQGARHDNHNATPAYARGFILGTAFGSIRTIMSTGNDVGCGTANNGCRVQFFSNPNVTFNGNAMGAVDRNNAQRLNETSDEVKNHRQTTENLTVTNETFDSEILANHLANSTITTSGTVLALSGSRVVMRATDRITLTPGFQVNAGGMFRAVLINQPCANLPPVANRIVSTTSRQSTPSIEPVGEDAGSLPPSTRIYPNPASDKITLEISLPASSRVSLSLTSADGNIHRVILANALYSKGQHTISFSTENENTGVYFYRLTINGERKAGKIVILKN